MTNHPSEPTGSRQSHVLGYGAQKALVEGIQPRIVGPGLWRESIGGSQERPSSPTCASPTKRPLSQDLRRDQSTGFFTHPPMQKRIDSKYTHHILLPYYYSY